MPTAAVAVAVCCVLLQLVQLCLNFSTCLSLKVLPDWLLNNDDYLDQHDLDEGTLLLETGDVLQALTGAAVELAKVWQWGPVMQTHAYKG